MFAVEHSKKEEVPILPTQGRPELPLISMALTLGASTWVRNQETPCHGRCLLEGMPLTILALDWHWEVVSLRDKARAEWSHGPSRLCVVTCTSICMNMKARCSRKCSGEVKSHRGFRVAVSCPRGGCPFRRQPDFWSTLRSEIAIRKNLIFRIFRTGIYSFIKIVEQSACDIVVSSWSRFVAHLTLSTRQHRALTAVCSVVILRAAAGILLLRAFSLISCRYV